MGVSLVVALLQHAMAHATQTGHGLRMRLSECSLDFDEIRQPLVMHPGRIDGRADVRPKVDNVHHHMQNRVDDGPPPGLPVMSTGLPPCSTIVGHMELSMRFPGAI